MNKIETTKVKKISFSEYLQLEGLLTLGRYHRKILDDLERAACKITGEKPQAWGRTGDAFYEDYSASILLEKLEIKFQ